MLIPLKQGPRRHKLNMVLTFGIFHDVVSLNTQVSASFDFFYKLIRVSS